MPNFEWFNVMEHGHGFTKARVQALYIQGYEKRGTEIGTCWFPTNWCKVTLKGIVGDETYSKFRYFPKLLFENKKAFSDRLEWWIKNFNKYMEKVIVIENFQWVITDKEKGLGYYSFKENGFEICLDQDKGQKEWSVYLCNRFEEVLEECCFMDLKDALGQANKFYRSFASMQ